MSWLTRFKRYLRDAFRGRRMALEIDEELRFHVEALIDELTTRGANPEEARRIAARRFGRLDLIKDEARYAKGVGLVDDLRQDVRYGLRRLRSQPGFAVAVILTFGVGIGVNAALFSIVDATILKPMPFRDAPRLVDILEVLRKGTAEETHYLGMSRARLDEWRAQRQIFDRIEPHSGPRPVPLRDGQVAVPVTEVSPGMFPMLGLSPALGRGFLPDEAGSSEVAVISDGLWKRAFGADPGVLGRRLLLKDRSPVVVGVMPPGTRFPLSSRATDAWVPLGSRSIVHVVARLRPGLALAAAQPALDSAARAIQKVRPDRERWGAEIMTIDPRRLPGGSGSRPVVLLAFGAVIFVLLTACANIANLLLARASSRQREVRVRRALGASRLRIVRQLLAEHGLLALGGAVPAVLLAAWLVRLIPAIVPEGLIWFSVHDTQLDWRVFGFTLGVSVAVGLLSGVLPAVRAAREGAPTLLSTGVPMAARTRGQRRTRNVLVAVQVAFALVLTTAAGLMVASFARMVGADSGYDTRNLLAVEVSVPPATYRTPPEQRAFLGRLLDRVRPISGVLQATSGTPPTSGGAGNLIAEGTEKDPESGRERGLRIMWAGADYFRVLGIRIVAGRPFSDDDRADAEPVGILDEEAARRTWPGQSPLGKRFRYSPYVPWITVVGVAQRVKTTSAARGRDEFELYLPESQNLQGLMLLVRTSDDPMRALPAIRARLVALEAKATVRSSGAVEEMYGEALVNPRFMALMMSLFAGLALLTAAIGVYAMLWYAVTQRTSELGVRVALGARPGQIQRLVFADVLRPVTGGMLVGLLVAGWLTKFIESQLYHVSPRDPVTIALVVACFVVIALLAASGPARRASRVDPITALRCE